jgi:hypothetical protein
MIEVLLALGVTRALMGVGGSKKQSSGSSQTDKYMKSLEESHKALIKREKAYRSMQHSGMKK